MARASKHDGEPSDEIKIGTISPQNIVEEMERSYLDYAMSVIVGRALPDVRDGLKPVHRRVLYAMWNIGLRSTAKFKKSAFVVGEVMAKYHPHGDSAIYDTLVRMAQDFSMRAPLVRGQGNFGSMDGDAAAAMRYTEAKLAGIAEELLVDLEKNTVDFVPNYDGSQKEPQVLPGKLPNLLINGTVGIAVGMASNIPPHNLREVCDAVLHLIEKPEATVDDLSEFVKGPDFPTGAIVYNAKDLKQAYATGKGGIVVRAKTEIAEDKKGNAIILVHEIPYQVNKATLLERIAQNVRDKKVEGIRDLRDESTQEGVRIVIELKKDAYPMKVLNRLYQTTQLQESFHYNMLALVDGIQPRVLNLKTILEEYLKHRKVVVRRRTQFELTRAMDRAHILEGYRIAMLHIDKIIETIKKSKDKDEAKINLIAKFKLSDPQTVAILEMRLQQLANLERLKVEQEYEEKMKLIKELEAILKSEKRMLSVIAAEVKEIRDKYGEDRRTQIIKSGLKEFSVEDVIPDAATMILITRAGYIKRLPPDTFKQQGRGGKGVIGLETKEDDQVETIFSTTTHKDLMFFTSRGRVFKLKAYEVPEASRTSKGQALVNFLELAPGETVTASLSMSEMDAFKYLVMVTNKGTIKKTSLDDFENVRRSGLIAIKLNDGDNLEWVKPSTGKDDIMLVSAEAQSIRFTEGDVRPMGRVAAGVRGIKLKGTDLVVGMEVIEQGTAIKKNQLHLLVVMKNGYGKRTDVTEYKLQGRGGSGVLTAHVTSKTGKIIEAMIVNGKDDRDMLIVSGAGQVIRSAVSSVPVLGRATQGVRIMRFKTAADTVASSTII
ncbi:DNA gyrase subunit A [Candidatus Uhrbacteria bacterium]|nr:DNA gyrase subunit A [Candidatus Uhrbacteria bacterium]